MRVVWEGAELSNRENTEEDKWLSLFERDCLSAPQIHARPCARLCEHSREPHRPGPGVTGKTNSETKGPSESRVNAIIGEVGFPEEGTVKPKAEK